MFFHRHKIFKYSWVLYFFVLYEISDEKLKHFFLLFDELYWGGWKPTIGLKVRDMMTWKEFFQIIF